MEFKTLFRDNIIKKTNDGLKYKSTGSYNSNYYWGFSNSISYEERSRFLSYFILLCGMLLTGTGIFELIFEFTNDIMLSTLVHSIGYGILLIVISVIMIIFHKNKIYCNHAFYPRSSDLSIKDFKDYFNIQESGHYFNFKYNGVFKRVRILKLNSGFITITKNKITSCSSVILSPNLGYEFYNPFSFVATVLSLITIIFIIFILPFMLFSGSYIFFILASILIGFIILFDIVVVVCYIIIGDFITIKCDTVSINMYSSYPAIYTDFYKFINIENDNENDIENDIENDNENDIEF